MFTGLVQAMGRVTRVEPTSVGSRLVVDPCGWDHRPTLGDSISVSGCCLTVAAAPGAAELVFDVVPETLSKTTLGLLAAGHPVNLEHSVTPTTLMGGHTVQGHVDGVGVIERVQTGAEWRVTIRPPTGLMEFVTPKGSICVDGVSLTVAAVKPELGVLEIALIPTTLAKTTLGRAIQGSRCNLEADILAKTMVYWLRNYSGRK